jgi:hypothetical protein
VLAILKNKLFLALITVVLVVVLLFIFLNLIYWSQAETREFQNQAEDKLQQIQTEKYLTKELRTVDDFTQTTDQITQSQQEVEQLLNQIDNTNLSANIETELRRDLHRALDYHRFSTCFVNKWQKDFEIREELNELDSLDSNRNRLLELTSNRQINLQQVNECLTGTQSLFALNSTTTDLQRNQFQLEEINEKIDDYEDYQQFEVGHGQVNFFGETNRRALQNQANKVLE